MTDTYTVSADELRQGVEQWERLEAEKADLTEAQKEVMAHLKATGYDTKIVRKIIADRKKTPDQIAEEQAVLELYRQALDMG